MTGLRVLVADDEAPALEELAYLLGRDPRVASVRTATSGAEVLKALDDEPVDAIFLDIRMPGLDGLDVARVLARFRRPPRVVFVTAYDEHAVDAFDLRAVDYLLKPVRQERLQEAVRRVCDGMAAPHPTAEPAPGEMIPVELGGVTRFVARSDVRYVEAQGDYARLHTADGSHLVRVALAALEESWRDAGFVRIHRSHLVALHHIDELRIDYGRCTVRLGDDVLQVSRRHTRELRDMLVRRARPGRESREQP
ncbi:MAG TPA: LytTR family DNA-binding domain-containing protein [Actinomycetes bacterium]